MRRGRRKKAQPDPLINVRKNEQIKAEEVRVLDEDDKSIGVLSLADALAKAKEQNLDLVEVSGKANPPVVKIISFDKYRYHETKRIKRQRVETQRQRKSTSSKRIQISIRSAQNDLDFKAKRGNEWLSDGNQLEIMMTLKGREKGNKNFAREKLLDFVRDMITVEHTVISPPRPGGRGITMLITPK